MWWTGRWGSQSTTFNHHTTVVSGPLFHANLSASPNAERFSYTLGLMVGNHIDFDMWLGMFRI